MLRGWLLRRGPMNPLKEGSFRVYAVCILINPRECKKKNAMQCEEPTPEATLENVKKECNKWVECGGGRVGSS